jgi:hypothetical protein
MPDLLKVVASGVARSRRLLLREKWIAPLKLARSGRDTLSNFGE